MWARRLVGEVLSQATRVAGQRAALTTLIVTSGGDQAAVQALFRRMTIAHSARMSARLRRSTTEAGSATRPCPWDTA